MHISILNSKTIRADNYSRIDPEFFQPFHIETANLLNRIGSRKLGCLADLFDGPFGSVLHADKYTDSGVPVLHMQNVSKEGFLLLDDPDFISVEDANTLYKHIAYPGDVIVTKIGFLGYATVLPEDYPRYFFRRETTRVKIRDLKTINPHYLATFLNSSIGRQQTYRFSSGATRDRILLVNQRNILIPILGSEFQKQISALCRTAYSFFGKSTSLYHAAENLLFSELGLKDWKPGQAQSYIRTYSQLIHAQRMDAEYFHPRFDELQSCIRRYPNGYFHFTNIANNSNETTEPHANVGDVYRYIELADINQVIGTIESSNEIKGKDAPSRARMLLRTGDVIASTVDGSLGKVALVSEEYHGAIGSTGFFVLRPRTVQSGYLLALVKSIIVREQMRCESSGTILAAVPANSLQNIIVPNIPQNKREEIARLVEMSHSSQRVAKSILEKAKRAVEIAIEEDEEIAMEFISN